MPVIFYKPELQCDFTTSLNTHTSNLESSEKQLVKICIRVQFSSVFVYLDEHRANYRASTNTLIPDKGTQHNYARQETQKRNEMG
jgi:ABC-type uncharacterized transport system ATPase component